MKASKPEQPEECLVENPYEFRRNDPDPPWFTIFSFLSAPALTLAALPILRARIDPQVVQEDFPNAVQFDGLAVLFGLFVAAGASSLLGLILAYVARRKDESWKGLGVVAWIINGTVAILIFFSFVQMAVKMLMFKVAG